MLPFPCRNSLVLTSIAATPAPASSTPALHARERRPDREGKKLISGHFPKSTWAELRRLSIEHETTSQDLLEEALADLFAKYRNRAQRRVEPTAPTPELSARQSAVLRALRAEMDANNQVAAKAAVLAEAAQIPLGSLHAVLQSLEKKQLIKTVRAGSARAPAVYQVL